MTKIIIALITLVVGVIAVSFGIAFVIFGIIYIVKGLALCIAQVEFVRMFVSLSLGLWLLAIANSILWIFIKILNPISEMLYEKN